MRPLHHILLVDDDGALREALAEILADEGYEVACASNGREALERLSKGLLPDLILLDLSMPVMDGWAFREEQRGRPELAHIPMMVLSASVPADSPRLRELEAEAVLSKPVGIDRLIGALRGLAAGAPVPAPALH